MDRGAWRAAVHGVAESNMTERVPGLLSHMHDVEGGDAVRGWWQALRTRCGCVCPCHPFGASWEPRTGVGA